MALPGSIFVYQSLTADTVWRAAWTLIDGERPGKRVWAARSGWELVFWHLQVSLGPGSK